MDERVETPTSKGRTGPSPWDGERARRTLRSGFGHEAFRPGQEAIVRAMAEGRDVLAVLPTGGGKSLCFQLPALLAPHTTIVVSPLIALMQDQVAALQRRGLDAAALSSATAPAERDGLLRRLPTDPPRLLYVSPERLLAPGFLGMAAGLAPARIVVDEAHCISEWGHDFRPEYRRIRQFLEAAGSPPVAAFTATATPATREDIRASLGLRSPRRFVASVDRPNLRWAVHVHRSDAGAFADSERAIRSALRSGPDAAALVYVLSRAGTSRAAAALRRLGLPAGAYHGGMEAGTRAGLQEDFLAGRIRVMCATNAFGMGVDHPTIRLVVHVGMPASLEAYVQEAGRAGRDGHVSTCLLLPSAADRHLHRTRIGAARRASVRRGDRRSGTRVANAALLRLRAMRCYVTARGCRRAVIARYFGESPGPCSGCDRCDRNADPQRPPPAVSRRDARR